MRSNDQLLAAASQMMKHLNQALTRVPSPWSEDPEGYSAQVELRLDAQGESVVFEATHIGPMGMWLQSQLLLEPGDEVWLAVPNPRGGVFNARAQVVEVSLEPGRAGMRLAFLALNRAAWQTLWHRSAPRGTTSSLTHALAS